MVTKVRSVVIHILHAIWALTRPNLSDLPPQISDATARDIGLSQVDIARARFVYPSQDPKYPRV